MAEGGSADSKANSDNPVSKSQQMEVNECLGNWLTYLQMLNGLCSAGTKLAQTLQSLLSSQHETVVHCRLSSQCLAGWEELSRATGVASNTVKHHVVAALRDHETRENDADKQDILRDNLLTFINLQYQFCVACCECLGGMAECSCPRTGKTECEIAALQQCFERLYTSPTPLSSGSIVHQNFHRSPLPFPLFPLQVQRRWSETAAAEMSGDTTESTMRRWSMPWDCRHVSEWPRQEANTHRRLRVPQNDRSRSITPDSVWKSPTITSQDGLQEAIQLLSCRPGGLRPSNQRSAFAAAAAAAGQHIPGVTLTTCNFDGNFDNSVWPESRGLGSPRCWPTALHDSHSSDYSDLSGHRDNSEHSGNSGGDHRGDSEQSGGAGGCCGNGGGGGGGGGDDSNAGNGLRDSKDSIHSTPHHGDHACQKECESAILDLLPSRKNSSSTDSCLSANSKSGSESACTGEASRSQLYSMWSGGDMPFIRLPESNDEVQDDRSSAN